MQISTALLLLLLVITSFTSQMLAHPGSIPTSCCFIMTGKKIPNSLLKSYKRITNSRCTLKAIVFKTKLGKEICADPQKEVGPGCHKAPGPKTPNSKAINNLLF